jgi:hypothetical protein
MRAIEQTPPTTQPAEVEEERTENLTVHMEGLTKEEKEEMVRDFEEEGFELQPDGSYRANVEEKYNEYMKQLSELGNSFEDGEETGPTLH